MSEQHPSSEKPPELTPRNAALRAMAHGGWANASYGHPLASTGYVARISNVPEELHEIGQAFSEEFSAVGFHDISELDGHFLYIETLESVTVTTYPDHDSLLDAFDRGEAES